LREILALRSLKIVAFALVGLFSANTFAFKNIDVKGFNAFPIYNWEKNGQRSNFMSEKNNPVLDDVQKALIDRNIYINANGVMSIWDPKQCSIKSVAHRGDFRYPENHESSIGQALSNGFDEVEVDVREACSNDKLKCYILSHDAVMGRVMLDTNRISNMYHITEYGQSVKSVYAFDFDPKRIKILDRNMNMLNESFSTYVDALKTVKKYGNNEQRINFEIKGKIKSGLNELDTVAYKFLKDNKNFYFSSMSVDTLSVLRRRDRTGSLTLSYIEIPEKESAELIKQMHDKYQFMDSYYSEGQLGTFVKNMAIISAREDKWGVMNFSFDKVTNLKMVLSQLGTDNTIYNVDIRSLLKNPLLIDAIKDAGVETYVYTINSKEYMIESLIELVKLGFLPSGAIIDFSPVKLCAIEKNGLPKRGEYKAKTDLGKLIQSLPDDADFETYATQSEFASLGMYQTYSGNLKPLPGSQKKLIFSKIFDQIKALPKDANLVLDPVEAYKFDIRKK